MLKLALLSLGNRRVSLGLTVLSIALSVALILGIERLRDAAREGFASTVSGVDLIVASRGNDVQILLATAYGVGFTANSMSSETYETLEALPETAWAVPLAMGDTYAGFPIVGTTDEYFEHFRYGRDQALALASGQVFEGVEAAVLGVEAARTMGHKVGDEIIAAHGSGPIRSEDHDEHPFIISGILAPTGTPVDRMIYVPLSGFALLHKTEEVAPDPLAALEVGTAVTPKPVSTTDDAHDHEEGHDDDHADEHAHDEGHDDDHADEHAHDEGHDDEHSDEHANHDHGAMPDQINAVFVGLNSRAQTLTMQRWISQYEEEPLTAVMPGAALLQLWSITGIAEKTLRIVAMAVVVAGVLGMLTMLSATLEARRREFAILRAVGATPGRIGTLILTEATLITLAGLLVGCMILFLVQLVAAPILSERVGIDLTQNGLSVSEVRLLALIFVIGIASSLLPALRVYRVTVNDGLNLKL